MWKEKVLSSSPSYNGENLEVCCHFQCHGIRLCQDMFSLFGPVLDCKVSTDLFFRGRMGGLWWAEFVYEIHWTYDLVGMWRKGKVRWYATNEWFVASWWMYILLRVTFISLIFKTWSKIGLLLFASTVKLQAIGSEKICSQTLTLGILGS